MKAKKNNYGNKRKPQRNQRIMDLRKKGLGYKSIAKLFDIHYTRVKQIVQQEEMRVREQV